MKKIKILIYSLLLFIITICTIFVINVNIKEEPIKVAVSDDKITDECTEEAETYEASNLEEITVSSSEITISPNASLTIVKHYANCGHTVNEYAEILPEMVNKTKEEIEKMYDNCKIQSFESNKLVMEKEETGFCGEHYVLRDNDGFIVVNTVNENDEESLYEKTSISTQYLEKTDLIGLQGGIRIYGKENLNSMIEDYE